ncbi:hypothetical protein D0962_35185 [Leptolyngbyaceae cyanobacterium CCMR0082]|uniref:Uncharacterized protein n=1 Tax=Adonisia turfae CCMR0082 TaxID=2304604 RepID=A0A6M0SHW9_9CYAN|nr:hypothetical protein [Adonisia turfae]MDV3348184.1 hypothetical protein [Leptothoe sp. LEGE 181152]NEZ67926.1 hypothetical protein [Adonisia turfae CCMR0082]
MSTKSQSDSVIQALRQGDLIAQQPSYQIYEVLKVIGNQILVICLTNWTIQSIAAQDIVPLF